MGDVKPDAVVTFHVVVRLNASGKNPGGASRLLGQHSSRLLPSSALPEARRPANWPADKPGGKDDGPKGCACVIS
jgi:hypothetical protein